MDVSKAGSKDNAGQAIPSKLDDAERKKRSQAHRTQARANMTKAQIARELSCVPQGARTRQGGGGTDMATPARKDDVAEQEKMMAHLKSIAPFHGRWEIKRVINSGSYGIVLEVSDIKTKTAGVIKIARPGVDAYVNVQAEWESFVLEKIFKSVSFPLIFLYFNNFFNVSES